MVRILASAFLAAALAALLAAGPAEAACRATPDGTGGARVRCTDGSTGRLRPDGGGGFSGRVGNKQFRLQEDSARSMRRDNSRATEGRGASGRGGIRDNTASGSTQSCMSGGLRVTGCN